MKPSTSATAYILLVVALVLIPTSVAFENYHVSNYSTPKCIPLYNEKMFNSVQVYFTGCFQDPKIPGFMSNYLTVLQPNLQSVAGDIQLPALPMVRRIASDGDKRVVFYHYDESSVGIFIFAINVPPFTYD